MDEDGQSEDVQEEMKAQEMPRFYPRPDSSREGEIDVDEVA